MLSRLWPGACFKVVLSFKLVLSCNRKKEITKSDESKEISTERQNKGQNSATNGSSDFWTSCREIKFHEL